jgi:hypothetical protein
MVNRDFNRRVELAKRFKRDIEPGHDTTRLRQELGADTPTPVDRTRRRDITPPDVFRQRSPYEVAIVVDRERF